LVHNFVSIGLKRKETYEKLIPDKIFGADEFWVIIGLGSGINRSLVAREVREIVFESGLGCLNLLRK
jgi:hypothetical protein